MAGCDRQDLSLLAGPGTGKTYVIVARVQYLVQVHGVPPAKITALTFTRAAAAEMRRRLEKRLGNVGRHVRVSTLHSYALREILRQGAPDVPLPVRIVGDWEERNVVVEELAHMLRRTVPDVHNPQATGALDRLSNDWDTLAADGSGWEAGHPDPQFLAAWRRHRRVYGYTLRSELVYQLLCELRSDPDFSPSSETEVLLVDEYQDLNSCDLATIKLLAERCGAEVFVAGDDDQSIYSFRGAHPAGIRGFSDDFAGAARLTLSECVRCGPGIVALANFVIDQEQDRVPKDLTSITPWTGSVHLLRPAHPTAEAATVARIAKSAVDAGTPPEEILVLVKADRNGLIASAVADALAKEGVGIYLPRGASEVPKDVDIFWAYLRLARGLMESGRVDDLSVRVLLQLEDNKIGETRLHAVLGIALERSVRFLQALDHVAADPQPYAKRRLPQVAAARDEIVERAQSMAQHADESFEDWFHRVGEMVGLTEAGRELVRRALEPAEAETSDERELAEHEESGFAPIGTADHAAEATAAVPVAGDYVGELVEAMSGLSDALPTAEAGRVTFTTMHGAKGLSADMVMVLQAEDEVIPGDLAGPQLDEVRRLFYVSITRARKSLVLVACQQRPGTQRYAGGMEAVNRTLTQFIRDYGLAASSVAYYLKSIEVQAGG